MIRIVTAALASAATLALAGPAMATTESVERALVPVDAVYGFSQIAANRYAAAEARLDAQRAAEPREPSVLINLAYVYAKTNRQALASALYEDVLALPNAELELGNGSAAWSHELAKRALGRNGAMASR